MPSTSNTKKKTESLETELLKIDNELFELEKKYGEFRVRKASNFVELAQAT
jgi:predicted  nucleic acid-binding Zn-ribbon protein